MPLLSSVHDLTFEKVQFCWKRNCLLNSQKSIMKGYRSGEDCFMEARQLLEVVSRRFSEMSVGVVEYKLHEDREFEKEKHLRNSFFKNFLMSVMVMCIKEGMLTINKSLKDRGKEPSFKLLYSPNIINLLTLLNMFQCSEEEIQLT